MRENICQRYSAAENRLQLVWFPLLGIVTRCQVYCSKIVHTDYPIKIHHFRMLCTKIVYVYDLGLYI